MGSGQSFYNIVITNPNAGSDLAAPQDGFVDYNKLEDYVASLETTPNGLTLDLSIAKRRANIRYREIILQTNFVCNCWINPVSLTAPSGSVTSPPTEITFQMVVEHGDSSLYTNDELNPGQFLTGTTALKRMIARGLQYTQTLNSVYGDFKVNVYDPTSTTTTGAYGGGNSFPRTGERIDAIAVGALFGNLTEAQAVITVTEIFAGIS